jgi:hypothetical protein
LGVSDIDQVKEVVLRRGKSESETKQVQEQSTREP